MGIRSETEIAMQLRHQLKGPQQTLPGAHKSSDSISNRQPKLLEICVTHTKYGTSHFLIDNFGRLFSRARAVNFLRGRDLIS